METKPGYIKSIELLRRSSSPHGFLASPIDATNYKRVWARDGVICGLAALASGDQELIAVFKKTLETLSAHQHESGTIPSNVLINEDGSASVSYGGLAGRVDAVTWYVIGICQYAYYNDEPAFVRKYQSNIEDCFSLLQSWEFNNLHLMYVPLSGNWADEYILEGYVLYDQLLRVWALQCYNHFVRQEAITEKINAIRKQIEINFIPGTEGEKYHARAYKKIDRLAFMPCCFSPAGYKVQFDTFAHALALLLNIGEQSFQEKILQHTSSLRESMLLKVLPAFWPPVEPRHADWNLLINNCKYVFRNYAYEFHNGGSWAMVNGFFGLALTEQRTEEARNLLQAIDAMNHAEEDGFYECFNSHTGVAVGTPSCAWSAAAAVMLHQSLYRQFKLLF